MHKSISVDTFLAGLNIMSSFSLRSWRSFEKADNSIYTSGGERKDWGEEKNWIR